MQLTIIKHTDMKLTRIILLVATLFLVCTAFTKRNHKPVYAFGFSASFTDTVVYYTTPQILDSVHLEKHGFLPYREHYSYQLKNYLEYQKKEKNRTCMVYFSNNLKKLQKEQTKLLNKYKKDKAVKFVQIEPDQFYFKKPEE